MKSRAEVLQSIQTKIRLLHLAYSTEQAYGGKAAQSAALGSGSLDLGFGI
jgi:hypothetical protein